MFLNSSTHREHQRSVRITHSPLEEEFGGWVALVLAGVRAVFGHNGSLSSSLLRLVAFCQLSCTCLLCSCQLFAEFPDESPANFLERDNGSDTDDIRDAESDLSNDADVDDEYDGDVDDEHDADVDDDFEDHVIEWPCVQESPTTQIAMRVTSLHFTEPEFFAAASSESTFQEAIDNFEYAQLMIFDFTSNTMTSWLGIPGASIYTVEGFCSAMSEEVWYSDTVSFTRDAEEYLNTEPIRELNFAIPIEPYLVVPLEYVEFSELKFDPTYTRIGEPSEDCLSTSPPHDCAAGWGHDGVMTGYINLERAAYIYLDSTGFSLCDHLCGECLPYPREGCGEFIPEIFVWGIRVRAELGAGLISQISD